MNDTTGRRWSALLIAWHPASRDARPSNDRGKATLEEHALTVRSCAANRPLEPALCQR